MKLIAEALKAEIDCFLDQYRELQSLPARLLYAHQRQWVVLAMGLSA